MNSRKWFNFTASFCEIALIFTFCMAVSLTFLVIGSIVANDYRETKTFDKYTCSGAENLQLNDGVIYSYGTVDSCVFKNGSCIQKVRLMKPEIEHGELGGIKRGDVEKWASSLGSVVSFTCYVDYTEFGREYVRGVSSFFPTIGWYGFMLFIGIIFTMGSIGILNYNYGYDHEIGDFGDNESRCGYFFINPICNFCGLITAGCMCCFSILSKAD